MHIHADVVLQAPDQLAVAHISGHHPACITAEQDIGEPTRRSPRIETAAPGVDAGNEPPATEPPASPSASGTSETLIPIRRFVDGENSPLPLELEHPLSLAPLQLAKGDRVKITLEIVDNQRRDPASDQPSQGNVFRADPLVLEVSDEAGVLAAVSETDEQSERKLNELIQQQLGIGDSE